MTEEQSQLTLEEILTLANATSIWRRYAPVLLEIKSGEGENADLQCTIETGYLARFHSKVKLRVYHLHQRNYFHNRPFFTSDVYGVCVTTGAIGRDICIGDYQYIEQDTHIFEAHNCCDHNFGVFDVYKRVHDVEEKNLQECEEMRIGNIDRTVRELKSDAKQIEAKGDKK